MKQHFSDFQKISKADWIKKIASDLKGKPLDDLKSNPEPDLEIKAYHHNEDAVANFSKYQQLKANNAWGIRKIFNPKDSTNTELLALLNQGINSIGIEINDQTEFDTLTKGVEFEHIASDIRFETKDAAINAVVPKSSILNFDVFSKNARAGENHYSLKDFEQFYRSKSNEKKIWVDGHIYGNAGASSSQELALILAHLNAYFQFLFDQGFAIDEIAKQVSISLSVTDNYFANIAKFRAIKPLVSLVLKGYEAKEVYPNIQLFAMTSVRHLAKNDANNNPLRQTTQAMSAVIGGCDHLTITVPELKNENVNQRFNRIAKNIQLILQEEAYLDKVIDPGAGAYYVESLTQQMINKAWNYFLEIEKKGGYENGLSSNFIQQLIDENKTQLIADLNLNQKTFLGINKHPNQMEKWTALTPPKMAKPTPFKPLTPFYLEDHYTKTQQ